MQVQICHLSPIVPKMFFLTENEWADPCNRFCMFEKWICGSLRPASPFQLEVVIPQTHKTLSVLMPRSLYNIPSQHEMFLQRGEIVKQLRLAELLRNIAQGAALTKQGAEEDGEGRSLLDSHPLPAAWCPQAPWGGVGRDKIKLLMEN